MDPVIDFAAEALLRRRLAQGWKWDSDGQIKPPEFFQQRKEDGERIWADFHRRLKELHG